MLNHLFKKSIALALFLPLIFAMTASATEWPKKPIHLILPAPPGGNIDVAARLIAPGLARRLGQPIVVENKPGAGGIIAGETVLRAAPDGYTLFLAANGPLLFSPMILGRNVYNWKKDFVPIGSISLTPLVLTARKSLGVSSLDDLKKKAQAGDVLMASPGLGMTNHLASELLQRRLGVSWRTIQYKGTAPAVLSLLSGETDVAFDQILTALPQIRDGKLVPLAVTTVDRIASLPNVPTLQELGLSRFQAVTFTGVVGPKGLPNEVVKRFGDALMEVLNEPAIVESFAKLGSQAKPMDSKSFANFLKELDDTWTPVIKEANITDK